MKQIVQKLLNLLFLLIPIKRKRILFLDYYGAKYGDSPAYLSENLISIHPDWEIVWAFNNPKYFKIRSAKKVRYLSPNFFYHLATSKVLITNYRMPEFYKKRKGQYYLQTWHSTLRLKKIEKDAEDYLTSEYIRMARNDSKNIDLVLSGCKISSNTFRYSFWYDGEVLEYGTPRIDRLINFIPEVKRNIRKKLRVKDNEKVILYCPTFRQHEEDKIFYLNPVSFYKNLREISPNTNWKLLIRYHPHETMKTTDLEGQAEIYDVTDYYDVQHLIALSDIMITDYSGLMFDYAYTSKPCFLYVPDLEIYKKKERSLYFEIPELPFPVSRDQNELLTLINHFNEDDYKDKIEIFLQKIGSFEKGDSCERIIERIEEWVK